MLSHKFAHYKLILAQRNFRFLQNIGIFMVFKCVSFFVSQTTWHECVGCCARVLAISASCAPCSFALDEGQSVADMGYQFGWLCPLAVSDTSPTCTSCDGQPDLEAQLCWLWELECSFEYT